MLIAEVIKQGAPERIALYGETPVTYRALGEAVARYREVLAQRVSPAVIGWACWRRIRRHLFMRILRRRNWGRLPYR